MDAKAKALMGAAKAGDGALALALVLGGARMDARDMADFEDMTAAHWAAKNGLSEALAAAGGLSRASVEGRDSMGRTPLMLACQAGHCLCAKALAQAAPESALALDGEGRSALHWAAEGGSLEACAEMAKAGCPVGAWDGEGETPAQVARACGRLSLAAELESWERFAGD